jgi:hypothetical protein
MADEVKDTLEVSDPQEKSPAEVPARPLDYRQFPGRGHRASLQRGLEQSARGETVDLGSFTQYVD